MGSTIHKVFKNNKVKAVAVYYCNRFLSYIDGL